MNILAIIIGAIVGDIIPAGLIILLIRLILRKRLSKGWCILVFILTTFCSFSIGLFFTGKPIPLGIYDYLIHIIMITLFLLDKETPSYSDTEKEILRKRELKNKNVHEET